MTPLEEVEAVIAEFTCVEDAIIPIQLARSLAERLMASLAAHEETKAVLKQCRHSMRWAKDVINNHLGESIRGASKGAFDELTAAITAATTHLSKP